MFKGERTLCLSVRGGPAPPMATTLVRVPHGRGSAWLEGVGPRILYMQWRRGPWHTRTHTHVKLETAAPFCLCRCDAPHPTPRVALEGGEEPPGPPPPGLPAYGPAAVSLTARASFNGTCNRQQLPPTALETSSNRPSNRSWDPIRGPFPSNAPHPNPRRTACPWVVRALSSIADRLRFGFFSGVRVVLLRVAMSVLPCA